MYAYVIMTCCVCVLCIWCFALGETATIHAFASAFEFTDPWLGKIVHWGCKTLSRPKSSQLTGAARSWWHLLKCRCRKCIENDWKCTKCTTRSSCLLCVCRTLERPDQDPQLDAFSMVLSLAYLRMSDVWAKWTATFWGSGQWHCSKCCQSVILVTFRCKMGLRWAGLAEAIAKTWTGTMWWYVMCHLQVMLLTYIVYI